MAKPATRLSSKYAASPSAASATSSVGRSSRSKADDSKFTPSSASMDDDDFMILKKRFQDIEERRLREWENYQRSHRSALEQSGAKAFLDLSIGEIPAGRIVVELFEDIVPQTVENFRNLITGTPQFDPTETTPKLDYIDSHVFRIDKKNRCICAGELQGLSISSMPGGVPLADENFAARHTQKGTLSMISRGPNTVGSAFSITLDACPALDFRQVVFGKVIDGFPVLEKLDAVATNVVGMPTQTVTIAFCGALTGAKPPGSFEFAKRRESGDNIKGGDATNAVTDSFDVGSDAAHLSPAADRDARSATEEEIAPPSADGETHAQPERSGSQEAAATVVAASTAPVAA